jgi:hypothetical protein
MREYYYILTYSSLLFIIPCMYHKFITGNHIISYFLGALALISFINWKNLFYTKVIHFIDRTYVRILFLASLSIYHILDIYQIALLMNITLFYCLSKYCYYKKYKFRSVFHSIFHLNALVLSFTYNDDLVIKAFSRWK